MGVEDQDFKQISWKDQDFKVQSYVLNMFFAHIVLQKYLNSAVL